VPALTGCRIAAIEVESSMKGSFRWGSAQPFLLGMLPQMLADLLLHCRDQSLQGLVIAEVAPYQDQVDAA
jgi:hypothetical protein